jgi:hypothetical protein
MTQVKTLTSTQNYNMNYKQPEDFAPHGVGSVLASLFYAIGEAIGNHTTNGKAIVGALKGTTSSSTFSLSVFKAEHLSRLGTNRSKAESKYNDILGSYVQ